MNLKRLALYSLAVLRVASQWIKAVRDRVRPFVRNYWIVHVKGLWAGVHPDYDLRIPMHDGVRLAASQYRPREHTDKLPTLLLRTPYDRLLHNGAANTAHFFARSDSILEYTRESW